MYLFFCYSVDAGNLTSALSPHRSLHYPIHPDVPLRRTRHAAAGFNPGRLPGNCE